MPKFLVAFPSRLDQIFRRRQEYLGSKEPFQDFGLAISPLLSLSPLVAPLAAPVGLSSLGPLAPGGSNFAARVVMFKNLQSQKPTG